MRSLWRFLSVVSTVAALVWGASLLVPPPQASLADEEQSIATNRNVALPAQAGGTIWRPLPAKPSTRPGLAQPPLPSPRSVAPPHGIEPRGASRIVVGGTPSSGRGVEVVSLSWGNSDQLVRDVSRIWPTIRVNRLELRNSTLDLPDTSPGGDDGAAAPVLVATRPNRICIVSNDPEAAATLKAVLNAFRPIPPMQGLPLEARRLQRADAQEVADEIENVVGSGTTPKGPRRNSAGAKREAGPLEPLHHVVPQSIRIYADPTTNTLIYQARPRERSLLEGALRRWEGAARPGDSRGQEPHPPQRGNQEQPPSDAAADAERAIRSKLPELSPEQRARILQQLEKARLQRRAQAPRAGEEAQLPDQHRPEEQPIRAQRQLQSGAAAPVSPEPAIRIITIPPRGAELPRDDRLLEPPTNNLTRRGTSQPLENFAPAATDLDGPALPRPDALGAAARSGLTQRIAQQQPATEPAQQPAQKPAQPAQQPAQPGAPPEAIQIRGLRGEVQIEVIPELGIFLIQATSDEDAAEVERIIKQIEAISEGRAPVVEVVPLAHAQATALAAVVNGIYSQILSSRGLVTAGQEVQVATSLVKPNALLLVAPKDDMPFLHEQIERLDQSSEPEMQFKTFRLEHAPAQILKEALDEFYAEPTGLGTSVRVTAEPRSNTLVVQAAPNDMAEITEWIRQIDVADSATINDLRIFKLKNANAADLAQILQTAILGVLSPASRAAGLGAPTGQAQLAGAAPGVAGVGGQQGAARLLQEATSSVLRFSVGDERGKRELVSGILSEVRITAEPASNALIVSAPEKSMELIAAVIKELDALPSTVASIQIFTLVHGDATNVSTMLQTLFQPQAGAEQAPQAILQAAGPGAEGSTLVPLRFSVDRRTNTIIAVGNQSDLITVNAIITSLDTAEIIERRTQVFRLEHSPAQDIATAINNLITTEQQQLQAIDPNYVSAFEQREREVIVVAEPVNNFLLISATDRYFERIKELIKQLDKRPPMVAIQVLIAQVEISDHDEFGVELGFQDSVLFNRSQILDPFLTTTTVTQPNQVTQTTETIVSALLNPGYNFNNQPLGNSGSSQSLMQSGDIGPQGLTNFAMGRVNGELGFGGLVLSAGSENVSILLRALKQCRRVDVLSRPQIVTLDNQPGYIQVGEKVPLITSSSLTEVGQTNQIELQNVGLIVSVTPRISPDDNIVTMVVDATKSELGPESEGIPVSVSATGEVVRSPRIPIITAQTTISARDGQTVIIGGLLTKDNENTSRRVPILSDIPILGYAFRYDLAVERRNELLIILTPHVIREDADAEMLKQVEARRMSWVLSDVVDLQGDIGVYNAPADHGEHNAAHTHEHPAPEMELREPAEGPLPDSGPAHDALDHGDAHPDGQPQASTGKRRGLLARALGRLKLKPESAREAVERRRHSKKVVPPNEQPMAARPEPTAHATKAPAGAPAPPNPWRSPKEQTVQPASRWQELEEIKNSARTESMSE